MNIALWTLQILLALHTVMGAIWKYANSEQTVPSLKAIPHGVWLGLGVIELACAAGLVLPLLLKPTGSLAPIAALVIAAEMALYSVVHLASGGGTPGQLAYWIVVAAFCAFIAYGRLVLSPIVAA
jgi:hypothetical protein